MKWISTSKQLPNESGSVFIAILLGNEFVYDMYFFRTDYDCFVCPDSGEKVSTPQYWSQPTNPELQQLN